MATIIGVILTFVLTIVIGNKIIQSRQQDSWIAQQRFNGQEKEYLELKVLSDQIASSINVRIYAMRRLALQLRKVRTSVDESVIKDYKDAVKYWNENVSSYYIRLSQLGQEKFRYQLEKYLHGPMRQQSVVLDANIQQKNADEAWREMNSVTKSLNKINGDALNFNQALLNRVHLLRKQIYFPERIRFTRGTIQKFSTWQLVKAVFITDVDGMSILRSPLDP